ncbi:MAG TPA: tyrosine-type recombinase/integrase [Ktedonobacteraceae bacterium]|nr:tyrosine-type recombinase/integrase [Ktedonobacteraceae bacterium]
MVDAHNDPAVFQEFREALGTRDPKTIATYLTTMRDFVAWLAIQPGGTPFHLGLVTETAIRGYMDALQHAGRAPRTRSKALSALRRFCRWAMDEGYLRRNPARLMERPTVVAMAPTELSEKQRFVLKQLVEQHATPRFAAIFALGYWAGLRISEIAALRLDQCHINQRAGSITVLDAKGGKTRTLDLHNMARRVLYEYLFPVRPQDRERDEESPYVFTSQRAAWLRQQGQPDHLSERGIEHLWIQVKHKGNHEEWERIAGVTFHDLRHDFAHRARAAGWSLEEIAVYLGHQTKDGAPALATTVRYTLPSRQQLKERIQELPG